MYCLVALDLLLAPGDLFLGLLVFGLKRRGPLLQSSVRVLALRQCVNGRLDRLLLRLQWRHQRLLTGLQTGRLAAQSRRGRPAGVALAGDLLEVDDCYDSAGIACAATAVGRTVAARAAEIRRVFIRMQFLR